ncbi:MULTISPECIES: hypothetical protein [Rhodococcus]|uniref:Uncharacterized protein n=1 Tax=Rhodococcus oxybenzonivorans TaxID=1990687 RepID=A0AAE4UUR8_9NOCA|nr:MULTISPECIES: hypothetical protein [Rhodococcus]MDV7245505.1 hypothetical protein [Rhodococcus oxybenzonivorans]MDV7263306.1 hypothetical protein [Rhodococcus oxybenzonivorans]MDV7276585.1 hypothetical protein [Rhodococcus oxybenzonivorans]MDV7336488.1 hypothetical protein [Rhodococcus oxybenzonivorans]MDV7346819.1 hypothetical protein [Rhodococcus oxybenzonivorans]
MTGHEKGPALADEALPVDDLLESVSESTRACPDCGQAEHAETCPILMGLRGESEVDREWFEMHPLATEYRRDLSAREEYLLRRLLDLPADLVPYGRVHVIQVRPGLRIRDWRAINWYLPISVGGERSC